MIFNKTQDAHTSLTCEMLMRPFQATVLVVCQVRLDMQRAVLTLTFSALPWKSNAVQPCMPFYQILQVHERRSLSPLFL